MGMGGMQRPSELSYASDPTTLAILLRWRSWCRRVEFLLCFCVEIGPATFREGEYIELCTKLKTTEVFNQQCHVHLGAVAGEICIRRGTWRLGLTFEAHWRRSLLISFPICF
ncbi:hypothetical protein Taro_015947 [Colocasia esculenta]|uniref:Uncharacterized protein n=1 Tax=Colocasia esculenta TaxID=4460 RepID=A0A843UM86_COLES|nr:hypothetical protein [Colocasia esculenta]